MIQVQLGRLVALVGVSAALVVAGGCENMNGGGKQLSSKGTETYVKPAAGTGVRAPSKASVTRADQQRDEMNQAAMDTQAAFDMLNAKGSAGELDNSTSGEPTRNRPQSRGGKVEPLPSLSLPDLGQDTAAPVQVVAAANRPASVPDATVPSHVADRTPEQRRADAVAELAQQLKPDIAAARQPLRAAIPLFGLESISPGVSQGNLDSMRASVSPDQRRVIDTTADLFRSLGTDPNLAAADPAAVANALRAQADRLSGGPQTDGEDMSLGTVAICQQVDGFGRYSPLRSNAFMAGRVGSMILYTEVEHFAQTPVTPTLGGDLADEGPRWAVELGQSVKLYFDADGSEQLSLPETVVKDASRAKRRDFFLVQRVDLPRTLSVGNYTLKVIVRDVASGAIAEQLTPIRVIADGSVARERSTPNQARDSRPVQGRNRVAEARP